MPEDLALHIEILWPALLTGLLILSTHVPLGKEILRRGIIFFDLAIAQMAALGLIIAVRLGLEAHHHHIFSWQNMIVLSAAMVAAMLLYYCRRLETRIQEALIGVMFMLAATGSILLLAKDPHGGEHLQEILVGQILWIRPSSLIGVAAIYACILLIWHQRKGQLGRWVFYPLCAITVTLSTQLVGVYLVFASLIIPALATYKSDKKLLTYLIGLTGYLIGLIFSAVFDLPPGATISWSLAISAVIYGINAYAKRARQIATRKQLNLNQRFCKKPKGAAND